MKKIFVFLLLMVVSFALKAQYPIQQNLGSDSTIIYIKGAARTVGGFINGTYTDTTAANLTRIRQYQAAQIFTTNDSAMWFRMPGATKWVRFMPATPPSPNVDTSYWSLSGNYVADRVATPKLGTTTGHELNIITNDTIRLTIPVYGIRRVTGNENRYLVIDTTIGSNMYVGYMDGGSGSTYTAGNGLTLSGSQFKLGGTLTEPTVITGDATNKLVLQGYNASNDGYLNIGQDAGYLQFGSGAFTPSYESEIYSGNLELGLRTSGNIYLEAGDIYTIGVPTVSSTTGRKVALIDTATGKVERIDPASLVSTPTLQQVLTAGSTLTTSNSIDVDNNDLDILNTANLNITQTQSTLIGAADGTHTSQMTQGNNLLSLQTTAVSPSIESTIQIRADSISIKPNAGTLNIDSLRTWSDISDTTHKKPMTWDTRNGRWEYAANWYGGGGGSSVTVSSGFFEDTLKISGSTASIIDRATYRENFIATTVVSGQGVYFSKYVASGGAYGSLDQGTMTPPNISSGVLGYGLSSTGEIFYASFSSFRNYSAFESGKTFYLKGRFRIDDLSDGTNNYRWYFGWIPGAQDTTGANRAYFYYNHDKYGGQWVCYSSDGTATQATASGTTVAADTWYELTIEVSPATSTKFYIDGTLVATNSTRTPAVATGTWFPAFGVSKTAGSTARNFFADYVFYRIKD